VQPNDGVWENEDIFIHIEGNYWGYVASDEIEIVEE